MAKQVGCQGWFHLYYSITRPEWSDSLCPITQDSHTMEMWLYETGKVIGVYVDHAMKDLFKNKWLVAGRVNRHVDDEENTVVKHKKKAQKHIVTQRQKKKTDTMKKITNPNVVMTDGVTFEERVDGETDIVEDARAIVSDAITNGETTNEGGIEIEVEDEVTCDALLSESDCVVSEGEDSEHSDFYVDSDGNYELDKDDMDYEKSIDQHVEWVGLSSHKAAPPITRSVAKNMVTKIVPTPHVHKGKKVFNPEVDLAQVQFEANLCFNSRDDVVMAIKKHAVDWKKDIKFTLRQEYKIQAKCKHKTCPWSIYVSRTPRDATWSVKSLVEDHDCATADTVSVATPAWLETIYGEEIRINPSITMDELKVKLERKHQIQFSDSQIYRLRDAALSKTDVPRQYTLIYRYGEEVRRSNPGSTFKIEPRTYANQKLFKRLYICYGAAKDGFFAGCRKVLLFDGCHIKNIYGGILLTVVSLDPNNGMFPIAYGVVEKERKESWHWFMELLATDLGIDDQNGHIWTVMSDKQKGLIDAVNKWIPGCEHRFCVYHLYNNFKLLHSGLTLKLLLWRAAKATRPADFEKIMEELRVVDKKAYEWLSTKEPEQWSKAYFNTMNKSDLLLNNLSECQNKILLKARKLPILDMLEAIRIMNMKRTVKRREIMLKNKSEICPRIEAVLIRNRELACHYSAIYNGHNEYQVTGSYGSQWAVNIKEKECSCRRWQLTGIPCAHAVSSLLKGGKKPEAYVHDCYKTATYLKVYNHAMHPLRSQDEWPEAKGVATVLQPPLVEIQSGRPKKYKRKIGVGEKKKVSKEPIVIDGKVSKHGTVMHCSNCHVVGHTKAKCPGLPTKPIVPRKYKSKKHGGVEKTSRNEEDDIAEDMLANMFATMDNYHDEYMNETDIGTDPIKGKAPLVVQVKKKPVSNETKHDPKAVDNQKLDFSIKDTSLMNEVPNIMNLLSIKPHFVKEKVSKPDGVGSKVAEETNLNILPSKRKSLEQSKDNIKSQINPRNTELKVTTSNKSCSQPTRPPWKPDGCYTNAPYSVKGVNKIFIGATEEDPPI